MRPDSPDLPAEDLPVDLDARRFDGVRLVDASLAGLKRPGVAFVDCELRGTDLANADARTSHWRRVGIAGCRLTGVQLGESDLHDVTISDCRADLAVLVRCELTRVHFSGCDLRQADLGDARLRTVVLEDCDLRDADLTGARFEAVELRRCRLSGVRGVTALRGVRMPWADVLENAGVFAAACGVQVLEG